MADPANWVDDDEWELINDDGFVYKRKKRARVLDPRTASASVSAPALPDLAAEEKNRRERKRTALIKLREKYGKEIGQWEHLSNALIDMQQKNPIRPPPERARELNNDDASTSSSTDQFTSFPVQPEQLSGFTGRRVVDELLSLAEIQEAVIQDASNLCDIAEALCSAREVEIQKSFTELPIWASAPHELISSLCRD